MHSAHSAAAARCTLIVTLASALAACGGRRATPAAPGSAAHFQGRGIYVAIAPDANQDSPVAVDLALVTNSKLLKMLAQVPVADWFNQKTEWELDNPKALHVLSWQWVPGQPIAPLPLQLPGGVKGALVFADYHIAGAKPVLVNPSHGVVIDLLTAGFAAHSAQ